jgi:hypothetical protein
MKSRIFEKVVLVSILIATIAISVAIKQHEKKAGWMETTRWDYIDQAGLLARLQNPATANLKDLKDFNFRLKLWDWTLADFNLNKKKLQTIEANARRNKAKEFQSDVEALLDPDETSLERLSVFQNTLKTWNLTLGDFNISPKKFQEIETICHGKKAEELYQAMVEKGFNLEIYQRIKKEARLSDKTLAQIIAPRQIKINTTPRGKELLVLSGWRHASATEEATFEAKEAEEEQLLQQKKDAEYDQCRLEHPLINTYYLVINGQQVEFQPDNEVAEPKMSLNTPQGKVSVNIPVGKMFNFNIFAKSNYGDWVGSDPCDSEGKYSVTITCHELDRRMEIFVTGDEDTTDLEIAQREAKAEVEAIYKNAEAETQAAAKGWIKTSDGYKIPTYADISPLLAMDGLEIQGLYIY